MLSCKLRDTSKLSETHFNLFRCVPGLLFDDFDNVLYGRFKEVRNVRAEIQSDFFQKVH